MSAWSDRILEEVKRRNEKEVKRNCTLSLKRDRYLEFQTWCRLNGHSTSHVIDQLIDLFLEEAPKEVKT